MHSYWIYLSILAHLHTYCNSCCFLFTALRCHRYSLRLCIVGVICHVHNCRDESAIDASPLYHQQYFIDYFCISYVYLYKCYRDNQHYLLHRNCECYYNNNYYFAFCVITFGVYSAQTHNELSIVRYCQENADMPQISSKLL